MFNIGGMGLWFHIVAPVHFCGIIMPRFIGLKIKYVFFFPWGVSNKICNWYNVGPPR